MASETLLTLWQTIQPYLTLTSLGLLVAGWFRWREKMHGIEKERTEMQKEVRAMYDQAVRLLKDQVASLEGQQRTDKDYYQKLLASTTTEASSKLSGMSRQLAGLLFAAEVNRSVTSVKAPKYQQAAKQLEGRLQAVLERLPVSVSALQDMIDSLPQRDDRTFESTDEELVYIGLRLLAMVSHIHGSFLYSGFFNSSAAMILESTTDPVFEALSQANTRMPSAVKELMWSPEK